MVHKLQLWRPLDASDQDALRALPYRLVRLRPHDMIVREGDRPANTCLMVSGFSYRHKIVGSGARQILSIHMKGDLADLQNSLLGIADHNLQALTEVEIALIPINAILELAFTRPAIGIAMWYETLVDGAIFREWTLNIGRRDARTRAAHMLCEFGLRLEHAGLGHCLDYELPMTQEQLADALALTAVHTNRTLMLLAEEGLIARQRKAVRIIDWPGLMKVGDFDPAYLHLSDSTGPTVGSRVIEAGMLRVEHV